jgi:cytochrome c2
MNQSAMLSRTIAMAAVACMACAAAVAQDPVEYFQKNCQSCHTIGGGRLAGPDLKNVTERQDPEWLARFIHDPKAMIDSGDAYAAKIVSEARGVPMPKPPQITRALAEKLVALIEAESKLEESRFVGLQISDAPFTEADVEEGRRIFVGRSSLVNGGAACNSCHSIQGLYALGGGKLGPDLTRVYERLEGRKSLSAWLMAPGTPTMQPTFKKHPLKGEEVHALVAYFEDAARHSPPDSTTARSSFLLVGLGLAAAMFFLFDAIWKRRFHSVRRPLVESHRQRGHQ